ncbi:MAG: hypothetical protein JJU34_13575 [Lunatimonas sp.]|uniref:hypothetical protein n=1 Tax=Lunatimonas sp. TaxID=2060141 RepID=UPI00263AFFD0|nr:hypothetical protein [Lunatimonas sp.]MCC5938302.1 hypothetical protein [Lunatimonas sp.]
MRYLVILIGLILMVAAGLDLFEIYPIKGIQLIFGMYASSMLLYGLLRGRKLKKDPQANE